jgi:chromosome segregation ATPase
MDKLKWLKDIVKHWGEVTDSSSGQQHITTLQEEMKDFKAALEEHAGVLAQCKDEKEELLDWNEALHLQVEDLECHQEAENIEHSQSCAMVLDKHESCEAIEDDLNMLCDTLTTASIELQQKDDELSFKSQEINKLIGKHRSILNDIKGE